MDLKHYLNFYICIYIASKKQYKKQENRKHEPKSRKAGPVGTLSSWNNRISLSKCNKSLKIIYWRENLGRLNSHFPASFKNSMAGIYRKGVWLYIPALDAKCPIVQLKNYLTFCETDSTSEEYIFRAFSKDRKPS